MPCPTIAMIRGYCIGGGVETATTCDLRIAADNARFAIPAARLGLGYEAPGIARLIDLVGPSFAKEIFFTARQFSAEEARTRVTSLTPRYTAPHCLASCCLKTQWDRGAGGTISREDGEIHGSTSG